jgi:glutaredoxin
VTDRLLVLGVAALAGLIVYALYRLWRVRGSGGPERLDVADLGLELMSGCCAFVVFTTPACKPCKAALRIVGSAAERSDGLTEITTVDASERVELAVRYGVRTIPTVFLITASGHVLRSWRDVPDVTDVEGALAAI